VYVTSPTDPRFSRGDGVLCGDAAFGLTLCEWADGYFDASGLLGTLSEQRGYRDNIDF
jgi:hypothetical protein